MKVNIYQTFRYIPGMGDQINRMLAFDNFWKILGRERGWKTSYKLLLLEKSLKHGTIQDFINVLNINKLEHLSSNTIPCIHGVINAENEMQHFYHDKFFKNLINSTEEIISHNTGLDKINIIYYGQICHRYTKIEPYKRMKNNIRYITGHEHTVNNTNKKIKCVMLHLRRGDVFILNENGKMVFDNLLGLTQESSLKHNFECGSNGSKSHVRSVFQNKDIKVLIDNIPDNIHLMRDLARLYEQIMRRQYIQFQHAVEIILELKKYGIKVIVTTDGLSGLNLPKEHKHLFYLAQNEVNKINELVNLHDNVIAVYDDHTSFAKVHKSAQSCQLIISHESRRGFAVLLSSQSLQILKATKFMSDGKVNLELLKRFLS